MIWMVTIFSTLSVHTVVSMHRNETDVALETEYKTTHLLNKLLDNYDKKFHPGYLHGKHTLVDVNIYVRSMGPISEMEMAYQMDCYFRQKWTDERLRFDGNDTLRVSINILERLWKPDTHFFNGQQSYLHMVTSPNKLLRIEPTGSVLYSMRLTIKASCPMHLEKFPMDIQTCPLQFGSHGYGLSDVIYKWTYGADKSIKMAPDMTLSQFDLIGFPAGKENKTLALKGAFSMLWANFRLRRHMGYFMINVYIPCSLLVIISWVGFWINREATSDRIALGITNVLTMAFLGIDNRRDLPKVSYSTALDYFVGACFAFVLATIIQFAAVHFFTKHGSGEVILESDDEDEDEEVEVIGEDEEEEEEDQVQRDNGLYEGNNFHKNNKVYVVNQKSTRSPKGRPNGSVYISHHHNNRSIYGNRPNNGHVSHRERCCLQFYQCLIGNHKYREVKMKSCRHTAGRINSVSRVDMVSRILFPLAFAIFNTCYWAFYLDQGDSKVLL